MRQYTTLSELVIHCAEIGTKTVQVTFDPIPLNEWPESIRNKHINHYRTIAPLK